MMKPASLRNQITLPQSLMIIAACLAGLFFLGYFDPVPERAPDRASVFLYYGRDADTVPAPAAPQDALQSARAALQGADYFGAYATGPKGRSGIWVGARTPELARSYALAQCGDDCRVVAERQPLHRDPSRTEPILTHAMATNIGVKWPFINDVLAIGGANAWGFSSKASGKASQRSAWRKAAQDCETRRTAEALSGTAISPPCAVLTLTDIVDLRPKPVLYAARFTVDLTEIVPAGEWESVKRPDPPPSGLFGPYLPNQIYGARAASTMTTQDVVREAGWPLAGETIALVKCNAGRRPGDAPCRVTHQNLPKIAAPPGVLQVSPDMFASFRVWQDTKGAGAFAISPYGAWGTSYGMEDADAAAQKAADWCWYYTRRNWEYRQVDKAFLDAGLDCRIIALRER